MDGSWSNVVFLLTMEAIENSRRNFYIKRNVYQSPGYEQISFDHQSLTVKFTFLVNLASYREKPKELFVENFT